MYWRIPEIEKEIIFKAIGSIHPSVIIGRHPQVLGGKYITIKEGVIIGNYARIQTIPSHSGKTYHPDLTIEANATIENQVSITCANKVRIGRSTMIASGVYLSDHAHQYEDEETPVRDQPLTVGALDIGPDCHIGQNAVIFGKIRIGKHSVVGANSVVVKDVPPYSIVAGVPAKVIKRFNSKTKLWEKLTS